MTVDLLTATFLWPEGTLPHFREEVAPGARHEDLPQRTSTADPLVDAPGETFWAAVLRQIGWPLPPKPAPHA